MPTFAHLTASTFFGGPERQMLGLASALPQDVRSTFLLFREGGRFQSFAERIRQRGFGVHPLCADTPHLFLAIREITGRLEASHADVLFCHGYKANLLGRAAARRVGVPVVAVSRGWTGESLKVRAYEFLDRRHLRWMDRVVCVSEAQGERIRRAGVVPERVVVIPNAIDPNRFADPDPAYEKRLREFFDGAAGVVVAAAGRLSPDKGFPLLIQAARKVLATHPSTRFILFGDGPLRGELEREIAANGLVGRFVLGGFRDDFDGFLPFVDILAQSSFTEGMPNIVLEALAARKPVVATAVGGTPELVQHGTSGYLVPPGDPDALASGIVDLVGSARRRQAFGTQGHAGVRQHYTFEAQSRRYVELAKALAADARPVAPQVAECAVPAGFGRPHSSV
jgi:glycosyltransferase involved in cell wall biosynthesis